MSNTLYSYIRARTVTARRAQRLLKAVYTADCMAVQDEKARRDCGAVFGRQDGDISLRVVRQIL